MLTKNDVTACEARLLQAMKNPIEATVRYIRVSKKCGDKLQMIGGGATLM